MPVDSSSPSSLGRGSGFDDLVVVAGPRGGPWFAALPLAPMAATEPAPPAAPAARALPTWQPASVRAPRARRRAAAWAAFAAMLGAPGLAAAATACSAYMGQVVINEVRVGSSNNSDNKNQVELYNSGGVAPAVWQTWSVQVWFKDGAKAAVKKGTYAMSAGHTSSGNFIWNNTTKYWLQNRNNKVVDIQILDATGALVAYLGVGSSRVDLQACKLEYSIVSPK